MNVDGVLFAVFLLYYLLLHGIWSMRQLKRSSCWQTHGTELKIRAYVNTMIESWVAVAVVAGLLLTGRLAPVELGLAGVNPTGPPALVYVVFAAMGLYSTVLVYQTIALRLCLLRGQKVAIRIDPGLVRFLPFTPRERGVYIAVALTAGITEEILFRGFFPLMCNRLVPGLSWVAVLTASSVFFGFVHLYLGWRHVFITTLVGFAYGFGVVVSGSLWPIILLHFLQDLSAIDVLAVRQVKQNSFPTGISDAAMVARPEP